MVWTVIQTDVRVETYAGAVRTPPVELADALVAHAERVLTEPGLRLEDVARLVGTSRARLYYYFAGQDDLRDFLVTRHLAEGAEVLTRAADGARGGPADRLAAVVHAAAAHLAERPGVCAGLLASSGPEPGGALAAADDVVVAPLRALLAEAVRAGELDVADVRVAADAAVGAILVAVIGRWRRGDTTRADAFADAVARQVMGGLCGLSGPVG